MSSLRRMVLISEQDYSRMKTAAPVISAANGDATLDQQQKIYANRQLEDRRMARSSEIISKAIEPLSSVYIKNSIEKFASQRRRGALDKFNKIQSNDRISWDEKGEVTIDSANIPGSNILDLLYFSTNTKRQTDVSPPGWGVFQTLLPQKQSAQDRPPTGRQLKRRAQSPTASFEEWLDQLS